MHDIKAIRDNPEAFDRGLARRGLHGLSSAILAKDAERRALIQALEGKLARRNAASKEIGAAKAKKDEATAAALMAEVASLKETIPADEAREKALGAALDDELARLPTTASGCRCASCSRPPTCPTARTRPATSK